MHYAFISTILLASAGTGATPPVAPSLPKKSHLNQEI
jgi:hypothetical protein